MQLDDTSRRAVLERYLFKCFVCRRKATHVDALETEVRAKATSSLEEGRTELTRAFLPFCRRCWAIVTGTERARKGQETKDFNRRQLPLRMRARAAVDPTANGGAMATRADVETGSVGVDERDRGTC